MKKELTITIGTETTIVKKRRNESKYDYIQRCLDHFNVLFLELCGHDGFTGVYDTLVGGNMKIEGFCKHELYQAIGKQFTQANEELESSTAPKIDKWLQFKRFYEASARRLADERDFHRWVWVTADMALKHKFRLGITTAV